MKSLIAIDPGCSGGIAYQTVDGVKVINMPETRRDTIDSLRIILTRCIPSATAYIEKVASYIPDGGASQMFEFGRNVERVGCILETLGVPIIEVRPQEWQKGLSLGNSDRHRVPSSPRGASKEEKKAFKLTNAELIKGIKTANAKAKRDWKTRLKAEAQRRWPDQKVTLSTCDALLILSYAIQRENGNLL